jgi:hypothetical protein
MVARWSSPRPHYVADLKTTFIAALRTIPIFGRIDATTGRWLSSHYLYYKVVSGVPYACWGAIRQTRHPIGSVRHDALSVLQQIVSDCRCIRNDAFVLRGSSITCHKETQGSVPFRWGRLMPDTCPDALDVMEINRYCCSFCISFGTSLLQR